jgi:DNA repair exonuclease SbcCD ATPase subunit
MAITDLLNKLANLLPEDSGEAKALLADAKREAQTIIDDLKSANGESKARKELIRELKAELESKEDFTHTESKLKAEIESLRKVKAEYDAFRKAEDEKIVNMWLEKAKVFDVPETDKRHATIQSLRPKFHFAEGDNQVSVEQAKANLEKLELLELSGALVIPDTSTPNTQPPAPGKPGEAQPQYQSSGAAIAAQLYGNKKT